MFHVVEDEPLEGQLGVERGADALETCNFCNGSGLFKKGFIPKKSWTEFVKFTGGTP